jgi:hypothetical protein
VCSWSVIGWSEIRPARKTSVRLHVWWKVSTCCIRETAVPPAPFIAPRLMCYETVSPAEVAFHLLDMNSIRRDGALKALQHWHSAGDFKASSLNTQPGNQITGSRFETATSGMWVVYIIVTSTPSIKILGRYELQLKDFYIFSCFAFLKNKFYANFNTRWR